VFTPGSVETRSVRGHNLGVLVRPERFPVRRHLSDEAVELGNRRAGTVSKRWSNDLLVFPAVRDPEWLGEIPGSGVTHENRDGEGVDSARPLNRGRGMSGNLLRKLSCGRSRESEQSQTGRALSAKQVINERDERGTLSRTGSSKHSSRTARIMGKDLLLFGGRVKSRHRLQYLSGVGYPPSLNEGKRWPRAQPIGANLLATRCAVGLALGSDRYR
jgi:hypothetical protein